MNIDPEGHKWWHWLLGIFAVVVIAAVVVASAIVTSGASLAVMGTMSLISAGSNFVGQGINNVLNGKGFFEDIDVGSIFISALSGAAFASGLGGVAMFAVGAASSVATNAFNQRPISEILLNGFLGGIISFAAYGLGNALGRYFNKTNDFTFNTFFDLARVDGAGIGKALMVALSSSWYKLIPTVSPGLTRWLGKFIINKADKK